MIAAQTVAAEVNPRADAVAKKVMGGVANKRTQARPPVEKVIERAVDRIEPVVEKTEPVVETVKPGPEKVEAEPVKPQKPQTGDKTGDPNKGKGKGKGRDKAEGADNDRLRELGESIDWSSAPETDMARALREALTGKKKSEDK